jgi:hypothetical protein
VVIGWLDMSIGYRPPYVCKVHIFFLDIGLSPIITCFRFSFMGEFEFVLNSHQTCLFDESSE